MSTLSFRARGEKIGKHLFGATLSNQGRGFYVCLELVALVRGTIEASDLALPDDTNAPLRIHRRSHDFARRLMGAPQAIAAEERAWLGDVGTVEALSALITGLRIPIPGRRTRPKWLGEHLSPYAGDLIHYDAVERKRRKIDKHVPIDLKFRVSMERYAFRGAGGLAHKALRTDPDKDRLSANRDNLRRIVADSQGPLGALFRVLAGRDLAKEDPELFTEHSEHKCVVRDSCWIEHLREGVHNICRRTDLPVAKIIDALLHWVPYCIARHQLALAYASLHQPEPPTPVEFFSSSRSIRRSSRSTFSTHQAAIVRALENQAQEVDPDLLLAKSTKTWRDSYRSFFAGTLGSVGAVNAMTGQRHYVASPEFAEALVLASLEPREEMPLERFFAQVLRERYNMVVDRSSAASCPELGLIDRAAFDDNAEAAAETLRDLGLLQDYSDMTRMVRGEVE